MNDDNDTFIYSEKLAAKKTAVSRNELREARSQFLEQGTDWDYASGNTVMFSEAGIKRLLNLVIGEDQAGHIDISALVEKNGAAEDASQSGPTKLVVVAIPINPRMVLANETGDPNKPRQLVEVGRNINFVFGDVLDVAPHATQKGIWRFLGQLPRDKRRLPKR